MRKANLKDISETERKSPKGKFHKFAKNVSVELVANQSRSIYQSGICSISRRREVGKLVMWVTCFYTPLTTP
jgi:hypothetical protein